MADIIYEINNDNNIIYEINNNNEISYVVDNSNINNNTGLQCSDLPNCPVIETIESTLVDLQDQIDNIPPPAVTLNEIAVGTGTGLSSSSDLTFDGTTLVINGDIQNPTLGNNGDQMLVVDNSGLISTQNIPSNASALFLYYNFS